MLELFIFVFGAVFGWFFSIFFKDPFTEWRALVGDIVAAGVNYANVPLNPNDAERVRYEEAQMCFRDLAAQVEAFMAKHKKYALWLQKRGYFPGELRNGLMGLSNSLNIREDRNNWKRTIEHSLKLGEMTF